MKTELLTMELHAQGINGMQLHRVFTGRDVVRLQRFWVPHVQHAEVVVLGVYGHVMNGNMLAAPITLLELNEMLKVVQFLPISRGQEAHLHLALAPRNLCLMMEATVRVERTWWHDSLDTAYRGWFREHPGVAVAEWRHFVGDRVQQGRMVCEINQCDESAVVGGLLCAAHLTDRKDPKL